MDLLTLLDTYNDGSSWTTDLDIGVYDGRLLLSMSDSSDYITGYFRSVEDIELVIKELQKYVDEVKK